MELSARDLANVLWVVAAIGALLAWPTSREGLQRVLQALFASPIVVALGTLTLYIGLCIFGLAKIGLWQPSDLALTLIWLVGSAFLAALTTKEIADHPLSLRKMLRDLIGVALVLQFIAGAYSLSLWTELLLVPVIFFLALVGELALRERRTWSVAILAYGLLAVIAAVFLYNGAAQAIANLDEFASLETVRDFVLPVALSAILAPALVFLAHYMTFERLYNGSRTKIPDASLRRYAMFSAIRAFGFNHVSVARFYRGVHQGLFDDRVGVSARIAELQRRMLREANPPAVDSAQGWSPYLASRFITTFGLEAHDYRPAFDRWSANSKALDVGARNLSAFFEFFVEGDEHIARRLRLSAYVDTKEVTPAFEERFLAITEALTRRAISDEAAVTVSDRVRALQPFKLIAEGRAISLRIDNDAVTSGGSIRRTFVIDFEANYELAL